MADRTVFPSEYDGPAVAALDALLAAAQAGFYTATVLSQMTINDKVYACKLLDKNTTLPAPDGTFVNPWEADGA